MKRASNQTGLTLIELLVVLALTAIVAVLAIPSFQTVIQNNRILTQANDFVTAVNLARSEAIKRGSRTTLCKSNSSNSDCDNSSKWENGWILFTDPDNPGTVDPDEDIIKIYGPLEGDNTLRGNSNVTNRVSFNSSGLSAGFNGQLIICDSRGFGENARAIVISNTGRTRTLKANDSDVTLTSCFP